MSGHTTSELRSAISTACQVLEYAGLGDMVWGHVSARDPDGRGIWMKSSGFGFGEVGPEQVLLVDWNGQVLDGSGRRHAEYPIHTKTLERRADVGAAVHAHPPYCIAFMATLEPLRPISHDPTLFVPPDVARFTETGDLIATPELGGKVAEALGGRNALFLQNHGIVTVGPDVPTAVMTAVLLERSCQAQLLALAAGGVKAWSSDKEANMKRVSCWMQGQITDGWRFLVREAKKRV